jgi:hypothetical protein
MTDRRVSASWRLSPSAGEAHSELLFNLTQWEGHDGRSGEA